MAVASTPPGAADRVVAWGQCRLRPETAAKVLVGLAGAALSAVVVALVLVSLGYLTAMAAVGTMFHWCRHVEEHWVPWWLGQSAMVALTLLGLSLARTTRRHRRARASSDGDPVLVLAVEAPLAYSLAGRPGQIVVSSGMLRRLDGDERRALLAHERSHLRHRHHHYLWLADMAAAVPTLRPLRTKIRYALERWADEDAAAEVGNREFVATALARAALAQAELPVEVMAAAGSGVPARVEALLAEGRPPAVQAGAAVRAAAVTALAGFGVALIHRC